MNSRLSRLFASLPTLALAMICAALSLYGCRSTGREEPKTEQLREIVLRSAAPEQRGGDLFSSSRFSHREVLERIADAVKQPRVRGVFLRLGGLGGAFARSAELREALLAVRNAKKPVHCYFEQTDNNGYGLLARVCDRISMAPSGLLALTGVRAETYYARDLLEHVGLSAEMLQVGKYKGAADTFTRTDMPPEVRETMGALLDDLQGELNSSVQEGRSLDAKALARAIDDGPHTARSALALKLIDAIAFDDEARAHAKQAAQAKEVVVALDRPEDESLGIGDVWDMLTGDDESSNTKGKRVVLAYLDGTIGDGEQDSGQGVQSGPFVKAMRRIADDTAIKAMVLRIDSPGGSALASDKMWHAVRRVAKRKPVVVSIGDMAASGGYYVACAGTEIFAEPSSIVGSIGVVGGKIVGQDLAARVGVHATALIRGRNANWMSPLARFSDSERAALKRALEETYSIFLSRVTEGRKLEGAKLDQVAQGRIMSGRRASEGGLVDKAGGLTDALARARSKVSLPADSAVEVWPKDRSFFTRVTNALSGASTHPSLAQQLLPFAPELGRHPLATLLLQGNANPLAVLPIAFVLD